MNLLEDVKKIAESISAEVSEKDGIYTLEHIIAERKVFLQRRKLIYRAKFRIDDEKKELRFTEMLKETSSGLAISAGFGFQVQTYKTGLNQPREGTIQEQSNLFGKKYNYTFNWGDIRKQIEEKAKEAGYSFIYKVTSLGL